MAMTDQEQKDLRSYCALLLKEYGFHFSPNDPVIPALYIIHKEMQLNNQNNNAIALLVKEASSKVSPKAFHFNHPGEAWKFQMATALKWILFGLLALVFAWSAVWYRSLAQEIDQARTIIAVSGNIGGLIRYVKSDGGFYFIDFTAAKGDSIRHFREFKKLNANTVRVFVGRKSK